MIIIKKQDHLLPLFNSHTIENEENQQSLNLEAALEYLEEQAQNYKNVGLTHISNWLDLNEVTAH